MPSCKPNDIASVFKWEWRFNQCATGMSMRSSYPLFKGMPFCTSAPVDLSQK